MKAASSSSSGRRKVKSRIRPKKKMRLGKSSSPSTMSSSSPSSSPTSSRLRSVENNVSVYVRLISLDDQLEWYSFVLNASDKDDERERGMKLKGFVDRLPVLSPLKTKRISPLSSCAAVGSTIYCFSGRHPLYPGRVSNKVHYLDTSLLPQPSSWPKGPSMLSARSRPCSVSLNGKLYVMGGTSSNGTEGDGVSEPWAEVFNSKTQTWVPLPSPSPKPSDFGLFSAALHGLDKVVVGSWVDDFVCSYNVRTECWERLDKERNYGPCKSQQAVAVGTTLFWFYDSKLHAYDLFGKRRHSGLIERLEDIVDLEELKYGKYTPVLRHITHDLFYWICFEICGCGLPSCIVSNSVFLSLPPPSPTMTKDT